MRARSADTDPAAEDVQVALLHRASTSRRLKLALSLTDTAFGLARRAIGRTLHGADRIEVSLRLVELHYGRKLAEAVRCRLAERRE